MYVDVAVLGARDPKGNVYTYFTDRKLPIGAFVGISFGAKRTRGIVIAQKETTNLSGVLPILRLLLPYPVATQSQIKLIADVARYYFYSLSATLAVALPNFPVNVLQANRQPIWSKGRLQRLLIAPTHAYLKELAQSLEKKHRPYTIYSSDLPQKTRAEAYFEVLSGKTETILATRSGLFLPFQKLAEIYLYDEHDWAYKEIREPRYHALTVAKLLARTTGAKLTVLDNSPRVQTWWEAKQAKAAFTLKRASAKSLPRAVIIDMRNHDSQGESLLSGEASNAIKHIIRHQKTAILYLNKKNDGGLIFCRACRFSSYSPAALTVCPQCKSTKVRFDVLNLKNVAKAVNTLLTGMGYVSHSKGEGWQTDKEGSMLTYRLSQTSFITITTQKVFTHASAHSFDFICVILLDTLLNLPEFRAAEKAYATLTQLIRLRKEAGKVLPLIIQTKSPDHPALQAFLVQDYASFAQQEILERKSLGYPPFTLLILFSFTAKTQVTAIKHANTLHEALSQLQAPDSTVPIEVIGPFLAPKNGLRSLQKTCEARILLKAPNRLVAQPYLDLVPKTWKIDIDPENIVT